MASGEEGHQWSVYDRVKLKNAVKLVLPDALMAQIDSAISSLEYARATAFLQQYTADEKLSSQKYDTGKADEAYKAVTAAMAAGKFDEAIRCYNHFLSS